MDSVYGLVRDIEAKSPDDPPDVVARRVERKMSAPQRTDLLLRTLTEEVEVARRQRVREVERQSVLTRDTSNASEQQRAEWAAKQERYESERAETRAYHQRYPMRAPKHSRVYREWAGSESGKLYLEERARESAVAEALRREVDEAGGPMGWLGRQITRWQDEAKNLGRLELTRELLSSSFALGDGTHVTWGEATETHHRQRMSLLARQVEGTVETMAIHETAIGMLRSANVACLNEITQVAA